MSTSVVKRSEV